MADVHSRIRYDNGVLELQELKGKAVPAKGRNRCGRYIRGDSPDGGRSDGRLSGDLKVDRFPLDMVFEPVAGGGRHGGGHIFGPCRGPRPGEDADPTRPPGTRPGSLTSDRIEVYGQGA